MLSTPPVLYTDKIQSLSQEVSMGQPGDQGSENSEKKKVYISTAAITTQKSRDFSQATT